MKKILLALAIALPLFSFAQTNDWAVCDIIETTSKGENLSGQIIYTVNTKNISDDILPEDLCVYLNTENEDITIDGGLCHQAFGADVSELYLRAAQEAIAQNAPAADISLVQQDTKDYAYELESFDAVMCVNSSELYKTYDEAIMEISKYAKAGGMVLMGDYSR